MTYVLGMLPQKAGAISHAQELTMLYMPRQLSGSH